MKLISTRRMILCMLVMVGVVSFLNPRASVEASGYRMTQQVASDTLANQGIKWTSSKKDWWGNPCSTRSDAQCTSLDQMYSGTITGLINFKNGTGCPASGLIVTGGTEVGHNETFGAPYTHYNGYKIDIADKNSDGSENCATRYIKSYFTYAGLRSLVQYDRNGVAYRAPMYKNSRGDVYAHEYWANHWDILYY